MRQRGVDDFAEEDRDTGADNEGHVTGSVSPQQAMNALKMEEWPKARRKKKYKMARHDEKLVIEARMICGRRKTKRTAENIFVVVRQ